MTMTGRNMSEGLSRRSFLLTSGSLVIASSVASGIVPAFANAASPHSMSEKGKNVTLYMGVPEWDETGYAAAYQAKRGPRTKANNAGDWGLC